MKTTRQILTELDRAAAAHAKSIQNYKYSDISEYFKFLNYSFERTNNIQVGKFYSFTYHFDFWKYGWDNVKFYDWYPFSFIFEINAEKNYAVGLNFHHIPLIPRQIWLKRVLKLGSSIGSKVRIVQFGGRPVFKISGLNYPLVYKVLRKSKIAIRRYNLHKMEDIRAIPIKYVEETLRYYAKTYYGVGINQIWRRYNDYNPHYKNI